MQPWEEFMLVSADIRNDHDDLPDEDALTSKQDTATAPFRFTEEEQHAHNGQEQPCGNNFDFESLKVTSAISTGKGVKGGRFKKVFKLRKTHLGWFGLRKYTTAQWRQWREKIFSHLYIAQKNAKALNPADQDTPAVTPEGGKRAPPPQHCVIALQYLQPCNFNKGLKDRVRTGIRRKRHEALMKEATALKKLHPNQHRLRPSHKPSIESQGL
ncbi:MAG: hypothetical protein M1816_006840 [Peltula sp. TS41687]|nr:MAG: hypothetical protein M1816_006840 [Peltula sp. TS41687]